MNRIDASDPDAFLLIAFFVLVLIVGGVYLIAERMTRKRWPDGHGDKYFNQARTINDE